MRVNKGANEPHPEFCVHGRFSIRANQSRLPHRPFEGIDGGQCVSALPGYRKRELGAYATAQALHEAKKQYLRVASLKSSSEDHSVYRKLGFRDVRNVEMSMRIPPA